MSTQVKLFSMPVSVFHRAVVATDLVGIFYCYQIGIMLKCLMRIIALFTLRAFWVKHPDAEKPLRAWYALASRANWKTPADIKEAYRNASFTANNRVIFNVKGNDYRLVVSVRYDRGLMFIRLIGTHRQYDKIDVETI